MTPVLHCGLLIRIQPPWPPDECCAWPSTECCCGHSLVILLVNERNSLPILNAHAVPNYSLVGKFSWNTMLLGILFVVQYKICPGAKIGLPTILEILNEYLSRQLGRYLPTKVFVHTTSISLDLMINAGVLWTKSRKLMLGETKIALGLAEGKSLSAIKWELMIPARRSSVSLVSETRMFLIFS